MVGHDDFGHGRHADGIGSQDVEELVFGRRFKRRALCTQIDAVLHLDAFFGGNGVGLADELFVIRFAHVRKAWTVGDVFAAQGMFGEVVDVVGNDHQVADFEGRVGAPAGVGYKQGLDAQFAHDADGEGHFLHRIALVVVETALHGHDVLAAQLAEDELAAVSLDGREGEVGDVLVLYFILFGDFAGQASQAGAKDDGGFGMCVHLTLEVSCRFLNFF